MAAADELTGLLRERADGGERQQRRVGDAQPLPVHAAQPHHAHAQLDGLRRRLEMLQRLSGREQLAELGGADR
eukprot:6979982-Prymnesium_polylepis.1